MNTRILVFLLTIISISAYSQEINNIDVPAEVTESFNKKFMRAEKTVWDIIHEKNYVADFFMGEKNIKAEFSPKGIWIESKEIMNPKSLYRPVENFIDQEFPGSKFVYGEKITRKDKNNSFYVQIVQKMKGVKDPPVTELFFDKTGRFEKVIQPEIPEDQDEVNVDEVNVYNDDFDNVVESDLAAEKKPKKKKKKEKEENGVYERQEVDVRSLPTPILDYVMLNFDKLIEYKIDLAEYLEDEEMGLHYHLIVKKEGLNQAQSDLYFSITGKFIKRVDPPEMFEELEALQEKKEEAVATEEKKREKPKAKQIEKAEEPPVVVSVDVPEAVSKYFSRRFPRAEEVVWEEYGDKNFQARFWYRDISTRAELTPEGVLVSTITEMDPKNIYAPVARYIDENYPGI